MGTSVGIRMVVAFAVMATASEAIRVYEGTNLGPPDPTWKSPQPQQKRAESRSDIRSDHLLKFSKELKPTPNLYKVKLTQQGYLQFLRYLADIPPLREYTFCLWFKSTNLTHPHPLFSYSMQDKARLLSVWYEPKDATVRMSVREDLVFKVPALVREGQWHHLCQSWNGVLGEWVLFFDGAKIGSGTLQKYKGTYVPGGGEVVVGQEPTDFHKGLDDGIEGEVFGFNLVDEAVKDEVIVAKHRPIPIPDAVPQPAQYVPPFKTLPPMKKSYQEIKAYIKSLPPPPYGTRNGPPKTAPGGRPPPKPHQKGKPSKRPGRPTRGKPRPHYKPVKAIVYERDDRKMRFDDSVLTKKLGTPAEEKRSNQIYDENYSIHSYKPPKEKSRAVGYEIREAPEEDAPDAKTGQRKARQSFDIYTARKANNLYEKANRARQQKKHAFHFEAMERKPRVGVRRSLTVEEEKSDGKPRDAIPVHEVVEEDAVRRKRRDLREEDLAAGFRPLPKMPDGFIDKFAGSDFRSNGTTTERSREADKRNDVYDAPGAVQLRRNMVVSVRELQRRPGPTSGSELVKRSYEECAADRGSPLRDKDRLVVSWSETPVRIYGGAVVTTALGLCGHF